MFHPEPEKPIKAVIHHLSSDSSVEDISNKVVALGFDVIEVHQMMSNHPLPHGGTQLVTLSPFLVTLSRNEKSLNVST
jgi:hypothetical protein